jgi:DNA-binding transcriptional LysR family regulator
MIWHKSRYQSPLVKEFIETLRREAAGRYQDVGRR